MTWHSNLVEEAMELPNDHRDLRRQVASIHSDCFTADMLNVLSLRLCGSEECGSVTKSYGNSWQSCP